MWKRWPPRWQFITKKYNSWKPFLRLAKSRNFHNSKGFFYWFLYFRHHPCQI